MCNVRRIDEFLERWPGAESGPGHIVLGDANLLDGDIDWCLALIRAVQTGERPEDASMRSCWRLYDDDAPEEIEATRVFLEELRALPEDERVEPGDTLCPVFGDDDE